MPVKIPQDLPARKFLENENIFVMTYERALSQDVRPLHIAVLNLMPDKTATETQILRMLGNTPLQVEVTFLTTASYRSRNTSEEYLRAFYKTFDDVRAEKIKFDGLVVTGAPVEKMDFTDVGYWRELGEIMEWASTNVYSSMYICWAAQAAAYYYYGLEKVALERKLTGIFTHRVHHRTNPLVRGFDDYFNAPHSRYTEIPEEDIKRVGDLTVLADSPVAGVYLAASRDRRRVFVFGHGEYDRDTLRREYERDLLKKGEDAPMPQNYFSGDDPQSSAPLTWRAHEALLFANWLNYYVYQATPYDIDAIK